jgi:hypothetical protein
MKWSLPTYDSMSCGATYFPPEVFIRSLMRSVMVRTPSSSTDPASPVLSQPSTSTAAVSFGFL